MAVIGKIREKSTLLLIIIGGAMIAFILGDLLSSGGSVFNNGPQNLAEIDGVEISGIEFDNEIQLQIAQYKERENRSDVPEVVANQIREQVWNDLLQKRIMDDEYSELGITVSSKELADITYGSNPHPQVKQAFTNPETGVFNSADVVRFIKNMDNDETGKTKKQWLSFEKAIKKQRQVNKYNMLISKGLYVTTEEARVQHNENNNKLNISYVARPYNALSDSSITVSDADIKTYYDDHQQEFKQEKIRNVNFVSFDIVPSAEDSVETLEWINDIYRKFSATENDSLFVSVNTDQGYDRKLYSKGLLPAGIDTNIIEQDSVGYMLGPILDKDGTYRVVKISNIKYAPDSVRARHIVISLQRMSKDSALTKADSVKQAIENGADFAEMARLFSDDPTNKEDTGNLGWFQEGVMLRAISDTCFSSNTKIGEYKLIESPVGVHIFQVLDKSPVAKKLQLGIIERTIEPSRDTYDDYFINSNQFSIAVEEGKSMEELAAQNGLRVENIGLREDDNNMGKVKGSRSIVRWAYNSEEGMVSEPFNVEGKFVIVQLTEVKEEGIAPYEKVKEQAQIGAIREKKAEMLIEEMKDLSMEEIAERYPNNPIQQVSDVNFSSFSIPKMGFEPEVQGKIFSLKQGDISIPIKGRNGVYIVAVDMVNQSAENADLSVDQLQLQNSRQSRVNYQVFEALKENADVKDNRYLFY